MHPGREDGDDGDDGEGRVLHTTRPWRIVFSVTTRGSTNWSR
jgi:hypothetical protein